MTTFKKPTLNKVKLSRRHCIRYLELIKKSLGSKKMNISTKDDTMEVEYEEVSLVFKNLYQVGFSDRDGYHEADKGLKSIRNMENIIESNKAFI